MPLSTEDQFYVSRAEGFLGLGMAADAEAELGKVTAGAAGDPAVLVVRLALYQQQQRWTAMQAAARRLFEADPADSQWLISLAYATRRAESIEIARLMLVEAMERFPKEPVIYYNLACYDSQLGRLDSARQFLDIALKMAPGMQPEARRDEDLKPLWDAMEQSLGEENG